MWGDDIADLFRPDTFRTGDADHATEDYYGKVKFGSLAYDQAVRVVQPDSRGPSWARQYEFYLRPVPFDPDNGPLGIEVEDRTERRPAAIGVIAVPIGGADPLPARAEVYRAELLAGRASLGVT